MTIEFRVDAARRAKAVVLLAHGAGAGMDTPFMAALARGLSEQGARVLRFEFTYMAARRHGARKPPERMPALEARFLEAIAAAKSKLPLFVAGKSMGGRVATRIADRAGARGVLAFGYPFHPPKKPDQLRVEHLQTLAAPCLIVQGTRDPFGRPDEVAHYQLPANVDVHWLADGDHSFVPRKASGRSSAQNLHEAITVSAQFVTGVLSGRTR
ncbi:MAG TPA: alpha/beta family hydrolase [Polyangiales bacterium]